MTRKNSQASKPSTPKIIESSTKPMNRLSEQTFKRSFTPLTSKKDGTVRLTFTGCKHCVTKDGERPFFSIVFSCMDVSRENPANISVLATYRYSESNVLGRLLKALGYVSSEKTEIILDPEDEFGYLINQDLSDIYDFLDTKRGLVFKGLMSQGNRNLYRIEVESLQPLLGNNDLQQRDYAGDEGLSETEIAIDLEVDGGDD